MQPTISSSISYGSIRIFVGDITKVAADAIVNAANSSLLGGGNIDGCIHRAAGPGLLQECSKLHGCETGKCKITGGYNLPAKHVIHAVGPNCNVMGVDKATPLLKSCYDSCLDVAEENNLESIVFCCISVGIFGFPKDKAARIALETIGARIAAGLACKVYICCYTEEDLKFYKSAIEELTKTAAKVTIPSPVTGNIPEEINMHEVPTQTLCRNASKYLRSLHNLPPKEVEFINKFPYAAALAFAIGADASAWVKHSIGYGWNILGDGLQCRRREPEFPIEYLYQFGNYSKEMQLTAVLGFNYELDYLRNNGKDISDYEYATVDECIRDYMTDERPVYAWDDIDKAKDIIAIRYFEYRNVARMFKDGTGKVHDLLAEALKVLEHIIDCQNLQIDMKKLNEIPYCCDHLYHLSRNVVDVVDNL